MTTTNTHHCIRPSSVTQHACVLVGVLNRCSSSAGPGEVNSLLPGGYAWPGRVLQVVEPSIVHRRSVPPSVCAVRGARGTENVEGCDIPGAGDHPRAQDGAAWLRGEVGQKRWQVASVAFPIGLTTLRSQNWYAMAFIV